MSSIRLGAASIGGALLLILAPSALANTYTPNKHGDHAENGCTVQDCTVREAVIRANNHPGRDTIVLKGGDAYQLSQGGTYEDLAADGDLDVNDPLTIKSSNAKLATVDGGDIESVFETDASTTFRRLMVRDGNAMAFSGDPGGGINGESGVLKVIASVIASNRAAGNGGGIDSPSFAGSKLIISRSTVRDNGANAGGGNGGGGIENFTTGGGVISKSSIVRNRTLQGGGGYGGGILNYTSLRIRDSTISANKAGGSPGSATGGGIANSGGNAELQMVNDTVANNEATDDGGGIANVFSGTVNMNAVTVARNRAGSDGGGTGLGGGVVHLGTTSYRMKNSLIAKNTFGPGGGIGPDCFDNPGLVTSDGHNLFGDNADCDGFSAGLKRPSDRVNLSNAEIGIAQLADNGGPTKTIALKQGSEAINHAGSGAPSHDQRGVRRRNPDIGAYERR